MARTAEAFPYQTVRPKARGMNKAVFALGAVLLLVSVIVITYAVVVQFPQAGCHWGQYYPFGASPLRGTFYGYLCPESGGGFAIFPTMPMTSEPYLSYGVLLAAVALVMMVVGYVIPKRTNQSGTTSPTN